MNHASTAVRWIGFGIWALLLPRPALAQVWPSESGWAPLLQGGQPLGDPVGDAMGERDLVGDAANPAAYVGSDAARPRATVEAS